MSEKAVKAITFFTLYKLKVHWSAVVYTVYIIEIYVLTVDEIFISGDELAQKS